jgi:hypothetical protein
MRRHDSGKIFSAALVCACLLVPVGCGAEAPAPKKPAVGGASHTGLTHVIRDKTPFYRNVPSPGEKPDGFFEAGTEVKVLRREEGGYWRVEAVDSGVVHVAAGAVAPAD